MYVLNPFYWILVSFTHYQQHFSNVLAKFSISKKRNGQIDTPVILPRSEHVISRDNISDNALKVLYRLNNADYDAYLVGGGVRDLLLGKHPKDFDIVTNAQPEEIRQLFGNCRLIGRRFRLAHVHFGQDVIEVATFRASHNENQSNEHHSQDGMILRDNIFGTIEEDAWRRDFSVNALYYNISDFTVLDYTGGLKDLAQGSFRMIGDPKVRFREDPVRMLRAVRLAAKLGFDIEEKTDKVIHEMITSLHAVSSSRLYEEVLKLFLAGHAVATFQLLCNYGLFEQLFPGLNRIFQKKELNTPLAMLRKGLENTDKRVADGKPVVPAFLFAVILWNNLQSHYQHNVSVGRSPFDAFQGACRKTIEDQLSNISVPRRITTQVRDVWVMQLRLENRKGKRAFRTVDHPRFRAAYDFLLLREEAGEKLEELCDWWTKFQMVDEEIKYTMIRSLRNTSTSTQKKKRRRRKKMSSTVDSNKLVKKSIS